MPPDTDEMGSMSPDELRKAKFYQDLFLLPEDERIAAIGHYIVEHHETVTILTDNWKGKLERYIQKLTTQFPMVEVFDKGMGPVEGCAFFKARRKHN